MRGHTDGAPICRAGLRVSVVVSAEDQGHEQQRNNHEPADVLYEPLPQGSHAVARYIGGLQRCQARLAYGQGRGKVARGGFRPHCAACSRLRRPGLHPGFTPGSTRAAPPGLLAFRQFSPISPDGAALHQPGGTPLAAGAGALSATLPSPCSIRRCALTWRLAAPYSLPSSYAESGNSLEARRGKAYEISPSEPVCSSGFGVWLW
jgi:hypothetical protein